MEGDPNKRPTFSQIIKVLGQCLTDKDVLFREMTKFTSKTSSQSGNTSNETTIMRPPINDEVNAYLRPLIPPGNRFEFVNRRVQRNKSITTIDNNSPGTGTCSTVTTIICSSNQSNENSNTSALNNARSNGLDGSISPIGSFPSRPPSASGRRLRRDSRLTDSVFENDIIHEKTEEEILAEKQRLNDELNQQFNEQVNEQFGEKYRPFITKISGASLNKLSEIFRNKDTPTRDSVGKAAKDTSKDKTPKRTCSTKSNLFNMLNKKSTEKKADQRSIQSSTPNASANELNSQTSANQPTTNNELILNSTLLNGHSYENTKNASFLQTSM